MSASGSTIARGFTSSAKRSKDRTRNKGQAQAPKSPPKPASDWVGMFLLTAKTMAAAAECVPFPYVKGVFGTVVVLLESIEKVKKNREDLKELCIDTLEITTIIRDQILAHGDTAAVKFMSLCEDLERCLQDILDAVKSLQKEPKGFRDRFKEIINSSSTTEQIAGYQNKIRTLRSDFVLTATMDTNFQVLLSRK
ncbi:hypothetical protein MVEN_02166800 [Mycena venus]|uniref:Uncharacterized protein n=1 Tax=Mycena venus TaxID=2733690 RepID=A0A8H7CHI9_9AGAR|nr:hypothetical protein MVEN_02166800 [Mycena venus]